MANFLSNALRIVSEELPQFFTQTGTPFLGKDTEGSVMKEKDSMQKEKDIVESLLVGAASALPVGKGVQLASKVKGVLPAAATIGGAATSNDPTALLAGPLGVILGSNDAEAMVVPARFTHSSDEIASALGKLRKGELPATVYKESMKEGNKVGGVYLGVKDNKIKSVISDEGARFTGKNEGTLGEVIKHDELFNRMPELKDIKVQYLPPEHRGSANAAFDTKTNTLYYNPSRHPDDVMSSILHETQHAVQEVSKFTAGSNPIYSKGHPLFMDNVKKAISKELGHDDWTKMQDDKMMEVVDNVKRQMYMNAGGEIEARGTQNAFLRGNYLDFPLSPDVADRVPSQYLIPANPK